MPSVFHVVAADLSFWLFHAPIRFFGLLLPLLFAAGGCTPLNEYISNGFKVGPNYVRPSAPVACDWIDKNDERLSSEPVDLCNWWKVFQDPTLDVLVDTAVRQNLTLRQAGFRILQARAARAIAGGNLFPQQQAASGSYMRNGLSKATATTPLIQRQFFDEWESGFGLAWELDFWGRFRRAVEAADADLDASVANYDQVMVTLLGDIASTYTDIRTLQERIRLARANVKLQRETYEIANARYKGGQVSELDADQAMSTLAQTEASVPQLELELRQATNRLCILLGIPSTDLLADLGEKPIPTPPADVVVGIPADLLRRRPDVRRAEREAAAQCARVGIAVSELYPHISISGTLDYRAEHFHDFFTPRALEGSVGPMFQWNVLNYGRLFAAIQLQDAKLAELIAAYQQTVLRANSEAENGIAKFLRSQERSAWLKKSVTSSDKAAKVAVTQYEAGLINFSWVSLVEQNLVQQQDLYARSQGESVQGLIETYRALGGGW